VNLRKVNINNKVEGIGLHKKVDFERQTIQTMVMIGKHHQPSWY
jgi:hypothetical protein